MGAELRRERTGRRIASRRQLERMGTASVAVGFAGENAAKAQANEYGNPERNVPARPFMRRSGRRIEREIGAFMDEHYSGLDGGLSEASAEELGAWMEGIVKRTIDAWRYPRNRPSTVRRKGFNKPLVDTGEMRDSVRVWIEPKA